jgi:hypothetical protein
MKKNLLLFVGLAASALASAQCSEMFISMYVCGSGNNKAIEIYNPTNSPIVMNKNYRLSMYDNGAVPNPNPSTYALLSGTVPAHGTWVLSNGQVTNDSVHPATGTPYVSPACDTALQHRANQLDSAHFYAFSYFNGDDALSLDKLSGTTWNMVDIFASIGEWPTTGTSHYGWCNTVPYASPATKYKSWTKYHSMIRKATVMAGVTTNPAAGTFNPGVEYDTVKINTYPMGSHTCNCATGIQEFTDNVYVNIYPNPVNSGMISISAAKPVEMVQVYSLVGALVYDEKMTNSSNFVSVNVQNLPKGVYLVKSSFGANQAHVSKIVIQ